MSSIYKDKLTNISANLYYLIPFVLLTGPALPDIFISLISVIFLYISFKERNLFYFKNYFFLIFLIFCIILIFSSLISNSTIFSLKSSLFYFRFGIFSLATWYIIDHKIFFLKRFTIALLITFCFAIIDGYFQYIYGSSIFGFNENNPIRLSLSLNDKLFLGGYLSRLFPILFALVIYNPLKNSNLNIFNILLISTLLVLIDILIYLSGERTALGLIFMFTIIIMTSLSKFKILRLATFMISILIIFLISINNTEIKERNIDATTSQIGITESSNKINIISPVHESMIISSWNMFKENIFFGIGPNNFRTLCDKKPYNHDLNTCSNHPHNNLAQIMAETGIFGTIIFVLAFTYVSCKLLSHFIRVILHKDKQLSDYQLCLLSAILLSLWPFLPTLNFFGNYNNVIYYLPVGFYLQSIYLERKKIYVES